MNGDVKFFCENSKKQIFCLGGKGVWLGRERGQGVYERRIDMAFIKFIQID